MANELVLNSKNFDFAKHVASCVLQNGAWVEWDGYNMVWNPSTLAFEYMTQPLIDATNSNLYLAVDGVETLLGSVVTELQVINSLVPAKYDYISRAWNAGTFTETWTFKTGGSGGSTVATITIVYDTVTMDNIVSVTGT